MKTFSAIVVLLLLTNSADACTRCGLFGNRCRFKASHVVAVKKVYVAPQAYQQPAQTITIQNNYNGTALASPIAPQGATVMGYQALAAPYLVSPEAMLNMSARYADHSADLADRSHERFSSLLSLQLSGQAEVAKIMAATQHLKAATESTTQSITVRTQNGKAEVTTQPPLAPQVEPGPANAPAAFVSCVKCHSGATPKGKLSLDVESFACDTIVESLSRISGLDPDKQIMPPPDSGIVLSPQEKGEIMQFLLRNKQPEPLP